MTELIERAPDAAAPALAVLAVAAPLRAAPLSAAPLSSAPVSTSPLSTAPVSAATANAMLTGALPELVEPVRAEPALQPRRRTPALAATPRSAQQSPARQSPAPQSLAPQSPAPQSPAPQSPAQHSPAQQSPIPRLSTQLAAIPHIPAPAATLRGRAAAHSVIRECLRLQASAQPRSRLSRILGRDPLHPDAASWYRGALGELEVARILGRLDRGWTVLHAVPVGVRGADIDHVVIGPAGTFTINTKNHGGKKIWAAGSVFMVNGQKRAHIKSSLYEAERASRLLTDVAGTPVAVTPLIVVVNPLTLVRKKPDVVVMSSADLRMWLRRRPQMQTDATTARIVWAAERADTWTGDDPAVSAAAVTEHDDSDSGRAETTDRSSPTAQHDPVHQHDVAGQERAFELLRAEVETANSRRHAWSLLGASAFLAAVIAAALLLSPFVPDIIAALMGE